ncbi:hypothetical protein ACFXPZ_44960, partial [Streptomyces sp. NPDC059101]|uniref:hypothetical protein n=1 Tax=Streptomyces sp. NPDC059101 TaxID=3346728 RepID=UPI0036A990F9
MGIQLPTGLQRVRPRTLDTRDPLEELSPGYTDGDVLPDPGVRAGRLVNGQVPLSLRDGRPGVDQGDGG